ncbi:MAG: flavin reductase [Anaerocolumna sp.]|jgi:multimeric flavodoxin WrbA|nr:flavin reductase [Anaerocolumna sp.]
MNQNWIAVVGSPRIGENTDLIVDYLTQTLKNKNITVTKYILDSKNITTCSGCECCIKTGTCIINDDISNIINHMKIADGFILASPTYNYNVTAQMKALLDRTFCLNDYSDGCRSRLLPNKKAVVVGVCRGKLKNSMGFTVDSMVKTLTDLEVEIINTFEYYDTKNQPVNNNPNIRNRLDEMLLGI